MKAPREIDPDMLVTIEIVQHAAEIVSRMPLVAMDAHLRQVAPDDPNLPWYQAALRLAESARDFELTAGRLAALEARVELPPIPDDWTTG